MSGAKKAAPPESGTQASAKKTRDEEHLRNMAMTSLGGYAGENDDNPVLSHLDAILDDLLIMRLACESTIPLQDRLESVIGRLHARVSVVRLMANDLVYEKGDA